MAHVEDLLNRISDQQLKDQLLDEIKNLKRQKKFGLVFEEHGPEAIPFKSLEITKGSRVCIEGTPITKSFKVINSKKNSVTCLGEDGIPFTIDKDTVIPVKVFGEPIHPFLEIQDKIFKDNSKPNHILIESDNYHALQLLQYTHSKKVDCIYIDPPYNTGAKDWKYNNSYVDRTDEWKHSKWISMMKKRIILAKELLKDDGVLIVTIDEHEINNLGVLLAEIFPDYLRHIVSIVINPKGTGKLNFSRVDEYAFFCVPNIGRSIISGQPRSDANETSEEVSDLDDESIDLTFDEEVDYENSDDWELRHARRRGGESSYRHQRYNQFYPIYIDEKNKKVIEVGQSLPLDKEPNFNKKGNLVPIWPIDSEGNHRCWRFIPDSMQKLIDQKRVVLGKFNKKKGSWTVNIWEKKPDSKKLKTVWWDSKHDAGTHGTSMLHKILGKRDAFPFPKSVYAVRDCIAAVVRDRPQAIILDFFAGSGTTLHATSLINAQDNGTRQCILVTNNELNEKQLEKLSTSNLSDDELAEYGICRSATWPRIKSVITGIRPDGKKIDGKYQVGRQIPKEIKRSIKRIPFGNDEISLKTSSKKDFLGLVGMTQNKVNEDPYCFDKNMAVLWDCAFVSEFSKILNERYSQTESIYINASTTIFHQAKSFLGLHLNPLIKFIEDEKEFSEGLSENACFFKLSFVDPMNVELGKEFKKLVPILWMMSGCYGNVAKFSESEPFYISEKNQFAVLMKESFFSTFKKEIKKIELPRKIFLVTDSEEAFLQMKSQLVDTLGIQIEDVIHLYKNYLHNFEINKGILK